MEIIGVMPETRSLAWRMYDGAPDTLPPEDTPVLVYSGLAGDSDGLPAIYALARDEEWGLVWRNPDFQDVQGDMQQAVETDDAWAFLPPDPRRAEDGR
jgi:hypothetical protein